MFWRENRRTGPVTSRDYTRKNCPDLKMIRFGKIVYHHGHEVLYEENRPDLHFGIDVVGLFGFGCIEHYVSLVYTDGFAFGYEDALCHAHGYANHYGDA